MVLAARKGAVALLAAHHDIGSASVPDDVNRCKGKDKSQARHASAFPGTVNVGTSFWIIGTNRRQS